MRDCYTLHIGYSAVIHGLETWDIYIRPTQDIHEACPESASHANEFHPPFLILKF